MSSLKMYKNPTSIFDQFGEPSESFQLYLLKVVKSKQTKEKPKFLTDKRLANTKGTTPSPNFLLIFFFLCLRTK